MHRNRHRGPAVLRATPSRNRAAAVAASTAALLGGLLTAALPAVAQQRGWSAPPLVIKAPPAQAPGAPPQSGPPSAPRDAAATSPYAAASALPATIGRFGRGSVTDFEARSPGLGASARYTLAGRQVRADVYLYDRNLRQPITEDTAAAGPVAEEFARSVREALEFYRSQNVTGTQRGTLTLPDGVLCAEFAVKQPETGRQDYSLACMAGAAGRFVKVRLTMPQAADAPEIARAFAHEAVLAARGRTAAPGDGRPPSGSGGKTPQQRPAP